MRHKLLALLALLAFSPSPVFAASPANFPLVPCNATVPDEFHPLRPYPGTPCNTTIPLNTPIFCGAGSFSHDVDVPATCGGKKECTFTKDIDYDITVDLTQVRIPILGNTQDDLDEATQVNNYLNWYLNGTVQQSEQPGFFSPTDPDRLVNFAGPIKKLLPQSTQEKIRQDVTKPQFVGTDYHNYLIGQGALGPERLDSFWKTLLLNIPFSSFEDTPGEVSFSAPGSQPEGVGPVKVTVTSFKNKVYVPHLASLDKLSTLVTSIFQPFTKNPIPVVPTTSGTCAITKAYTLPSGDSLMGPVISLHLSYTQEFKYDARESTGGSLPSGAVCIQDADCQSGSCSVSTTDIGIRLCDPFTTKITSDVNVTTNNRTPLIDNIFWNLVGSPQSLIKRFAPQTSQIKDGDSAIPAAATDPAGHQVLFAKLGSLFEHILGGSLANLNLQRLLRPKDVSSRFSSITNSSVCSTQCNSDPSSVEVTPQIKLKFADLANRKYGVGKPRLDKFDHVIDRARRAGLDPIFVLAEWYKETGASNYLGACQVLGNSNPSSGYCQAIQDFGVNKKGIETKITPNGTILEDHFEDQFSAFLNLPGYYQSKCPPNSNSCHLETWGAMFREGNSDCLATANSNRYIETVIDTYKLIAPNQTPSCYPTKL